jgi:hypothetical protein
MRSSTVEAISPSATRLTIRKGSDSSRSCRSNKVEGYEMSGDGYLFAGALGVVITAAGTLAAKEARAERAGISIDRTPSDDPGR